MQRSLARIRLRRPAEPAGAEIFIHQGD